jgi:hypothetical protein
MNVRVICNGRFALPMPLADARTLFTPEGERGWAGSSWNPIYPVPGAAKDDSSPGTVFTTESDGGEATWIVLERSDNGMRYARVAHDRIAGTIDVVCTQGESPDVTEVEVTYDVTSLSPEGSVFAKKLQASFDEFLEGWQHEIVASLSRGGASL